MSERQLTIHFSFSTGSRDDQSIQRVIRPTEVQHKEEERAR